MYEYVCVYNSYHHHDHHLRHDHHRCRRRDKLTPNPQHTDEQTEPAA